MSNSQSFLIDLSVQEQQENVNIQLSKNLKVDKEKMILENLDTIEKIQEQPSGVNITLLTKGNKENPIHLYLQNIGGAQPGEVQAYAEDGSQSNKLQVQNLSEGITKGLELNTSIIRSPIWSDIKNLQITPDQSFRFVYNKQITATELKNVTSKDKKVIISEGETGEQSFMLTHAGMYGPVDVNLKVTISAIKGSATLDFGSEQFMRWTLGGKANLDIQYEFFDQNHKPLKVSGYTYFRGINTAKTVAFKKEQIDKIFSPAKTNIQYDDTFSSEYTYYGSYMGGWTSKQELGAMFSDAKQLNWRGINNDPDESSFDYGQVEITTKEFNSLTDFPNWKESVVENIPKENYFTFLYSNKIEVDAIDGNPKISKHNDGFVVDFDEKGTILIKNVGYYEGQWISLYVKSNMKTFEDIGLSSELTIKKNLFLRWVLHGKISNNISYEFVDEQLNPIEVSGYMTFVGLNVSKNLGLNASTIKNLYSTKPSDIKYWQFGDVVYLKSNTSGFDDKHEFTMTYKKTNKLDFFLENNDTDYSSLDYKQNTKSIVDIPDPKAVRKTFEKIEEQTNLYNQFNQIIPYEPPIGRKSKLEWVIHLSNKELLYFDQLKITDEDDQEQSDLFDIVKEEKLIRITPKADTLTSEDFYNHLYQFRIDYKIDYEKEIKLSELDKEGYYLNENLVQFTLDNQQPIQIETRTPINFKSKTQLIYQDEQGNVLLKKEHDTYITQTNDLTKEYIDNVKVKQHEFVSSESSLSDYQNKYTKETIQLNYRKYKLPELSINGHPEEIMVQAKDGKLKLDGKILLDADTSFNVHMKFLDRDEIIGKSDKISAGLVDWLVDKDYRLKGLEPGKTTPVEIYAIDETGSETNHIPLNIYYAGDLSFKQTPTNIEFGLEKIPSAIKQVQNKEPYKIEVSDLRGSNRKYNLYLTMTQSLSGNGKTYEDSLSFVNSKQGKQPLIEGEAIVVGKGDTGKDNTKQTSEYLFPVGQGIQLTVYPDMKKGTYNADVEWLLVDAPS